MGGRCASFQVPPGRRDLLRRAAALLALAFALGCTQDQPSEQPAAAANAAWPPLVDLNGVAHRPFEQPSTKAVTLIFVLPECPIANSYLPEINRLDEEFALTGVAVYLVQADPATTAEQARTHAAEYEMKPAVILDSDHAWVRRAGATKTPEAVVFSRAGEILYRGRIDDRYVGLGQKRPEATTHELRDALAAIAAGQRVPVSRTDAVGCYIPELPKGK